MIKIQHSFVVPDFVHTDVNEDLKKSWLLYYLRGHTIENSTASCKQFIYDTDVQNIIHKFISNPEDDTDYLIVSWFGIYANNFWNIHRYIIDDLVHAEKTNQDWIIKGTPDNKDIVVLNLRNLNKYPNLSIEKLYNAAQPFDDYFNTLYVDTLKDVDISVWNQTLKTYTDSPLLKQELSKFISQLISTRNYTHSIPDDKGVFFFSNTEKICPDFGFLANQNDIDTIITPCSMFKAFILGEKYIENTQNYIHFDIFERNVYIKKAFTNLWNGTYETLASTLKKCVIDESALWNKGSISEMIQKEWQKLLEHFGNEETIKTSWYNYQQKNHQYTTANLLFNDTNIISCLNNVKIKGIYHCIGDIPGFRSNALQFGIKNITNYTIDHLEKIENITNNFVVDIKLIASDKQQIGLSKDVKDMFLYEQQYYEIKSE
jgi:hypothetical protein